MTPDERDATSPASSGREREIKLELPSEGDLERLLEALPAAPDRVQRNHYFDRPDRSLRAAGVMLRLRLEGDRARLTVKEGAVRDGAGLFDVGEHEALVAPDRAAEVAAGTRPIADLEGPILDALRDRFGDLGDLNRWGTLENRRSKHPLGPFTLEVDRARYPDGTFLYEVECESDDPEGARRAVTEFLDEHGIPWQPSTESKAERLARRSPPAPR